MNFDLNISNVYLNVLIILSIIGFVGLISFIIVSYLIIKFLKLSIDDNSIFFYKYNKKSQKILDKYGDCKISKIYLIKQPLSKFIVFCMNILTLYDYQKCVEKTNEKYAYHTAFLFKLITKEKIIKFILLEKNSCINISDNFKMYDNQEMKAMNVKKSYTLNEILTETKTRIGNSRFFNWNAYKNNCIELSREILRTINKLDKKTNNMISCDEIINNLNSSEFTFHIINCLNVVSSIVEKYVNGYFY